MKNKTWLLCFLAFLFLILVGMAGGEERPATPIRIEADRMESSSQEQTIIFAGHVEARQDDIRIQADTMTVTYVRPQNGGDGKEGEGEARTTLAGTDPGRDISKLTAEGHVEINRQDWRAVGERLEFFSAEKKVIMTGNAKAWQDKNMVSGERIVLFLDEGKSVVERSSGKGERVKAFIYPEGEKPAE
jgi:lipopolysaccharide export system protein LptA